MPLFVRRQPADLKCSSCGSTATQLVECVQCLRESRLCDVQPVYCSGESGCFTAHWMTRKHGPNGGCKALKNSAAPSPQQLRPVSAARSLRGATNGGSGSSGSSSPSPGTSPSLSAPVTPPPPPRKVFAQRYSPHAANLHTGGLRPMYTTTQRAVSAGGPSSRDG